MGIMTFKNLPKEKRIRILNAAKKEFSRVPFEKVLISNIIKEAKIPRGSFYQYFDSIEQLFITLLFYLFGKDNKPFDVYLDNNNHDILLAVKMKFYQTVDRLSNDDENQLNSNIFISIFNNSGKGVLPYLLEPRIITDKPSIHRLNEILGYIEMINLTCLYRFLTLKEAKEKVKDTFNHYLELIKSEIKLLKEIE